jgi:hypothetical protein
MNTSYSIFSRWESDSGIAQAGIQSMNSFLSLMTNPYADRSFTPESPQLLMSQMGHSRHFHQAPITSGLPR